MNTLPGIIKALGSPDFKAVVKQEIEHLDAVLLPLQQGLAHSSYVYGDDFTAIILNINEPDDAIEVKAGIFYKGVAAGCGCDDDPTPISEQNEYCELLFTINCQTSEFKTALVG